MANEFKHKDAGTGLSRDEDNAVDRHEADSQAANDIIYFNGTSWIRSQSLPSGIIVPAPAINGIVTTTGLSLPAFTLLGNLNVNSKLLTSVGTIYMGTATVSGTVRGNRTFANQGEAFVFSSYNASDVLTSRMAVQGGYDEARVIWSNCVHSGIKLYNAITLNGQDLDAGAGNAVITTTGSAKGLEIDSIQDGVTGVELMLYQVKSAGVANDIVARIDGKSRDDGGGPQVYCTLRMVIENPANGSEAGKFEWHPALAGSPNLAMSLSSTGVLDVDASSGLGAATVGLFDEYDDAVLLKQGISGKQLEVLEKIGVMRRKKTGSGWFLNVQAMCYLLAGGIYQNRARVDDSHKELDKRIGRLELALPRGG